MNLILGTFNAEYFWKPEDTAGFPSMTDPQSRNLIYAMDDLLALGTADQDYLLTRFGFDAAHREYLQGLGFRFQTNTKAVVTPSINGHKGFQCISEALKLSLNPLPADIRRLKPYSITRGIGELNQKLKTTHPLPSNDLVAKVNSKAYSTALSQLHNPAYEGRVIRSGQSLETAGMKLLQSHGRVVLKESYGVAGNGNVIVDAENRLNQLVRQFSRQEAKGRSVALIIEPFLDKVIDFSSHWYLDRDGTSIFLGFQEMVNDGFTFSQMRPLAAKWEKAIQQSDYLSVIDRALQSLHQDGYYGPVCIDSMMLRDGAMAPIVEINARMSMGLLNLQLNERFEAQEAHGTLCYLGLMAPYEQQQLYHTIQQRLQQLQLDYSLDSPAGFMILSANTLRANAQIEANKPYRARLYLWHHHPKENTLNTDMSRLCTALQALGINVQ